MFENNIRNTPFAGSLADCMFRRINGSYYMEDTSLLSTLRALLMQRMPNDLSVTVSHHNLNISKFTVENSNAAIKNAAAENHFDVFDFTIELLEENALETGKEKFHQLSVPEGYRELEDVKAFFAEKMDCRVFINEERHSVIFAVLSLSMRKYHLLQCVIPKLLPWFFVNNRINVQERDLLLSLREKTPASYNAAIDALSKTDVYRQLSTSSMLTAFKQKSLQKQKKSIESMINNINAHIDSLNRELLLNFRSLNDENFKLNGVLNAINGDDNESDDALGNFLASNRKIDILGYSDDYLRIAVRGYLDVYDPEAYESLARNQRSWYWDYLPSRGIFNSRSVCKKLLDSIFGENPTFKIKTVGVFRLDVTNGEVSARSASGDYLNYLDEYHPNPHLYYNGCLGAHRAPINKALAKGDIIGAISQCISSVHSVNVTESASFRYVPRNLFTENKPVLEGPDGQCYTPTAAIQYLDSLNTTP